MTLKIKTKILLWYGIIFTLLIALFIGIITSVSSIYIEGNAKTLIKEEATETAEDLMITANGPIYIEEDEPFKYIHDNVIFVIYEVDVLAYGTAPTAINTAVPFDYYNLQTYKTQTSGTWLIYDIPIDNTHTLRSFYSLAEANSTYQTMLVTMLIASPIFILVSLLGGYVIIKKAFRPIKSIYETSESIKDHQDYHLRIKFKDNQDEISNLANMINHMLDNIEHAIKREQTFSTNISHELRTPMTVLRAQVEYLATKSLSDDIKKDIEDILKQLDFMDQMINQLLELTRAKHIQREDIEPIQLVELLRSITESFEPLLQDKKINLRLNQPTFEPVVDSNLTILVRILHNIFTNAIKYNKTGGSILVDLEENQQHYVISIKDTGIGMDKKTLEAIYQPFYRADQSRSIEKGLGIGLTITKELIAAIGGNIQIDSELGIGTTVTILLPKLTI